MAIRNLLKILISVSLYKPIEYFYPLIKDGLEHYDEGSQTLSLCLIQGWRTFECVKLIQEAY